MMRERPLPCLAVLATLMLSCPVLFAQVGAQEWDSDASDAEIIHNLTLQNQEVHITNERLRAEISKHAVALKDARDSKDQTYLIVGSGIFLVGLLIGILIGSRLRSRSRSYDSVVG